MGRKARSETLALEPLAFHLAGAANRLGGLAGAAFRGFFEMTAELHFPEDAFALHLFLERLERLIDVVIPNQNLHLAAYPDIARRARPSDTQKTPWPGSASRRPPHITLPRDRKCLSRRRGGTHVRG